MSLLDGEPSAFECGAPWNEEVDNDGNIICGCTTCKAARRRAEREERESERYDDEHWLWQK